MHAKIAASVRNSQSLKFWVNEPFLTLNEIGRLTVVFCYSQMPTKMSRQESAHDCGLETLLKSQIQ